MNDTRETRREHIASLRTDIRQANAMISAATKVGYKIVVDNWTAKREELLAELDAYLDA